jgi:hypothetical protein
MRLPEDYSFHNLGIIQNFSKTNCRGDMSSNTESYAKDLMIRFQYYDRQKTEQSPSKSAPWLAQRIVM